MSRPINVLINCPNLSCYHGNITESALVHLPLLKNTLCPNITCHEQCAMCELQVQGPSSRYRTSMNYSGSESNTQTTDYILGSNQREGAVLPAYFDLVHSSS